VSGDVVSVGVVGAGFAARAHVDALRRIAGVRIAGIAASTPDRSRAVAADLGLEPFDGYASMLRDDRVEVVDDCTPNDLHLEVNEAALRAGKHLLSEKPLAMDSAQTARLVDLASSTEAVTGVCFNYRHFPLVQQLRAELASADHGRVRLVTGGYLQDWLLLDTDWNWRLEPARGGASRAVADIGSHWIDLVQHVTNDRIVEVCADLGRVHDVRRRPAGEVQTFSAGDGRREPVAVGTEDFGSVLFATASGASGAFTVSQVSAGRKNHITIEVDTDRTAFAWDQERPNTLWIGHRDAANETLPRDPTLLGEAAAPLAHYPGGHEEGWPDALRNLLADVVEAVRARRRGEHHDATFASFADAHHTTMVVEAILASDRARGWIGVGTTEEIRS
jgi:predicted dehydrogenase